MENPYKILGVSPKATDSEVKKAYRELAKKYHPDNYINSPLADLASEKMKLINEAYATVNKERESKKLHTDDTIKVVHSETEIRARHLITEGRISEADVILNRVPKAEQTAEWHYLMGVLCMRRGMIFEARKYAEIANKMDNTNSEYLALLKNVSKTSDSLKKKECSLGDICHAFVCGDICKL